MQRKHSLEPESDLDTLNPSKNSQNTTGGREGGILPTMKEHEMGNMWLFYEVSGQRGLIKEAYH